MNKIPYCLPLIDDDVVKEVTDALLNTGWITSGPKVKEFEGKIKEFTKAKEALCVNSWVSGAMLILKWFGVGHGDEVIIPAYTYSATALAVLNVGATPVMVDVKKDFNIDTEGLREYITNKTKVIIPVDIAGWPCDYSQIFDVVKSADIKELFQPNSERQEKLGRVLVFADAAHSIGATLSGHQSGTLADISGFSFHSVKNITTGEGGAVCLNLPAPFNNNEVFKFLKFFSLNGQTKSAFEKNKAGGWRYDIVDQGLKVNMPDLNAAIGLSQIKRYANELLPERKMIFERYNRAFKKEPWAILPPFDSGEKTSSYHLYLLRVKNISEDERDQMIEYIAGDGVGVNVHYIPMAMLTLFRNKGYKIADYPVTYQNYKSEITLPIYNGLSKESVDRVIKSVIRAYKKLKHDF